MNYKDIEKANESIRTTDIKGKDYAEVPQRIKAFRMVYPDGFITTRIVSMSDGICVMRADVGYYNEEGRSITLGNGTAQEKENSSFINKTSYIENCETSAVGRALGMCGFGIDVSVASAEEVKNAIANQNTPQKLSQNQFEILSKKYTGKNLEKLLSNNGIEKLEDLPMAKASELIALITKKGNQNNVE